jgi:two-component system chemotaxis response regulator CheB
MQVNFRGLIELNKEPAYKGLRPSVNYLFDSMARTCGPRALGILMTGMGDDGADGLKALHDEGGLTIAQDEATCIVYGMPREAVIRGGVSAILSLDEIAHTLSYLADGDGGA